MRLSGASLAPRSMNRSRSPRRMLIEAAANARAARLLGRAPVSAAIASAMAVSVPLSRSRSRLRRWGSVASARSRSWASSPSVATMLPSAESHRSMRSTVSPAPVRSSSSSRLSGASTSPRTMSSFERNAASRRIADDPLVADVLALQRSIGNRAVARVVASGRPIGPGAAAGTARRGRFRRLSREVAIHAGEGTTDELRAERDRLVRERDAGQSGDYDALIEKLDRRIGERSNSTLPDATVSLAFDGRRLTMTGTTNDSWPAVSGRPDSSGSFDYSQARQHQESTGPIPEGVYWIDPGQLHMMWLYSEGWGYWRITIHPFDTTHDFGRGGFFIHGGSTPGSAGCIDLAWHMNDFADVLRRIGGDKKVKIIVSYPPGSYHPSPDPPPPTPPATGVPDFRWGLW